ncbi:PAP2 family protein [Chitinophaga silvatica]|uniref:PAP2 family protein n=1 Tax=Chitinophaga silvatica TaxID=2282649 RepID=A0A3E1Y2X0_9BACT|nr:phosphatase PAP2 family protein [Chitinophaga silvatica]RFS18976.1 PAP2 family protein [Chitinophaga silvatica]
MKTLFTLFRKNPYFFLPYLLCLILGGYFLATYSQRDLFLRINGEHSEWGDVIVTGLTYLGDGVMFGVVLFLLLIMQRFRLFFMGLGILLLVTLIVQVGKHYFNAPRPISYFGDEAAAIVHTVSWVNVHSSCSFPSGHSAAAFGLFSFLAVVLPNKRFGFILLGMALCAAYSRIYLAQHFFLDVYVGSLIGTLCTVIVYNLFNLKNTTAATEVCTEHLLQAQANP